MADHVLAPAELDELSVTLAGELLEPADAGYDDARRVWNGAIDRRPAVIVRCAGVADVVAAVGAARDHGMPVAVRGGGHSASGYGTCDGGMVIDLSPMKGIDVDPQSRTVRAEPGLTWGEFDRATQAFGLAVTGGRFSTTGIAGLTLGSGSGWLERRCGLTSDNLLAAELVTADGRLVTASPDENADLFWGLRGGGGNFGVVTSFRLRLHQIGPTILGGLLLSTPDRAGAILELFRELMPDAPDDLGGGIAFVSAPPEPFVPADLQLQPAVGTVICWTGDMAEGEGIVRRIREVAQPAVDLVQPMPYAALQSMLDAGAPHGIRGYMKAEFLTELSDSAIAKLTRHGARRAGPFDQLLIEPMGGAIGRMPEDATALGRRDVPWCYHALGLWMEPDRASEDAHVAWARALAEEMAPETTPGVYLNYVSDQSEDRVRSSFGAERYDRLVALKDIYDPTNLFRLNQNVRPSARRA